MTQAFKALQLCNDQKNNIGQRLKKLSRELSDDSIKLEFSDGSSLTVVKHESWRTDRLNVDHGLKNET